MQGFELRAMQWFKHGDSEKVERLGQELEVVSSYCCLCNRAWDYHGRLKPTGEILCPGSWIPKDFDDAVDIDV